VLLARPRSRLLFVLGVALAALAALLAVRPPLTNDFWAQGDDLALVSAWTIAVLAGAWLFVVTGACLVAVSAGRPRLARRLAAVLPSGIRRTLEVAIVTACVALPAVPAGAVDAPHVWVATVDDQPVVRAPLATAPAAPAPVPRPTPPPTRPEPAGVERVVVRPGDNLWLIARAALTRASAAPVDDSAIARYWRDVIRVNRPTLRSGDPSLIFPGEMITLPPAPRGVS
jgi:hypothetical protein